ncbi:MAG: response regulator [Methermicoccaceae archaeon]
MAPTILLIDDDDAFIELFEVFLHMVEPSAKLYHAQNMKDALSLYEEMLNKDNRPDLTVIDYNLKSAKGTDVAMHILDVDPYASITLLSASTTANQINEAEEMGLVGVVEKSYKFKETVENLLALTR